MRQFVLPKVGRIWSCFLWGFLASLCCFATWFVYISKPVLLFSKEWVYTICWDIRWWRTSGHHILGIWKDEVGLCRLFGCPTFPYLGWPITLYRTIKVWHLSHKIHSGREATEFLVDFSFLECVPFTTNLNFEPIYCIDFQSCCGGY